MKVQINHNTETITIQGKVTLDSLRVKLEDLKDEYGYKIKNYQLIFFPEVVTSGYIQVDDFENQNSHYTTSSIYKLKK